MRVHFIQHVSFESPGSLVQWAQQQQYTVSYTYLFEPPVFPAADSIDLLVIMGGPMGVYEETKYGWMQPEKTFIRDVIRAGKKVLGICLGSQLIAEVLGARVYPHTQKEIGWWPVQQVQDTPVTKGLPHDFITFHWHGDTFDLPQGALHIFSTPACAHQGYLVGNNVAALQFHPEATASLADQMLQHGRDELQPAPYIQTEDIIRAGFNQHLPQQPPFLAQFMENFLAL